MAASASAGAGSKPPVNETGRFATPTSARATRSGISLPKNRDGAASNKNRAGVRSVTGPIPPAGIHANPEAARQPPAQRRWTESAREPLLPDRPALVAPVGDNRECSRRRRLPAWQTAQRAHFLHCPSPRRRANPVRSEERRVG